MASLPVTSWQRLECLQTEVGDFVVAQRVRAQKAVLDKVFNRPLRLIAVVPGIWSVIRQPIGPNDVPARRPEQAPRLRIRQLLDGRRPGFFFNRKDGMLRLLDALFHQVATHRAPDLPSTQAPALAAVPEALSDNVARELSLHT